jgi:integrase
MASLTKRPGSPYWIACFTSADGRQLKKSTKIRLDETGSRRKAEEIAWKFEDAHRENLSDLQAREVMLEGHRLRTGRELRQTSVKQWCSEYLELRAGEKVSPATLDHYRAAAESFCLFLGERAYLPAMMVGDMDGLAWKKELLARGLSEVTTNRYLTAMRSIWKEARRKNLIAENIFELVPNIRNPIRGSRRDFTKEELKKVWDVADQEWRSMMLFGCYLGGRIGDCALLKWSSIRTKEKAIHYFNSKSRKWMSVAIAPPLWKHLSSWKKGLPDKPIHTRAFPVAMKRSQRSQLSHQFANILYKAGLREKVPKNKRKDGPGRTGGRKFHELGFHSLKHTIATWVLNAGASDGQRRAVLGHEDIKTSERYSHADAETTRPIMNKLPDLFPVVRSGQDTKKKKKK